MDKYQETFDTWNNVASIYQDKFMNLDLYNSTYDHFCESLAVQRAKVLEIGCGPGNITRYLLSKRSDLDIFGIDIAPNMIELAKVNNPKARFAVMDARSIRTLDTHFDGIVAGFCLPYLSPSECKELISDAFDLLDDNGIFYLSFVEGDPNASCFKVGSGGRVYFQFHDLDDLTAELSKANFTAIKTFRVSYKMSETESDIHTIIIAGKKDIL